MMNKEKLNYERKKGEEKNARKHFIQAPQLNLDGK